MDDRRTSRSLPQPGERWVLRHRLPDGSATDVIGWVERLDDDQILLSDVAGTTHAVSRASLVAARRAPLAAGGPPPHRVSAAELARLTRSDWLGEHQPLGEWLLRAAAGFTRRANSCHALGDPGVPADRAAAAILAWSQQHGIAALAEVVRDSAEETALLGLGWQRVGEIGEVLACRLGVLVADRPPDPQVRLDERLTGEWLALYRRSRPSEADPNVIRRLLAGPPPCAYAACPATGEPVAIARGRITGAWLGINCVWVDPAWRRRGPGEASVRALAQWAARRGARYAYVRAPTSAAVAGPAYQRLGFTPHHSYGYLAPPDPGPPR